jgi:hypothetical protein
VSETCHELRPDECPAMPNGYPLTNNTTAEKSRNARSKVYAELG